MELPAPSGSGAAALLLLLAGCATAAPAEGGLVDRAFYVCPDDVVVTVDYFADDARVDLPDGVRRLSRLGPDGDRYGDEAVEVQVEGRTLRLARAGTAVVCQAEGTGEAWRDAIARGVTFRALGQEPGWLLEMDRDGRTVVLLDYGVRRLEAATPEPRPAGGGLEYRMVADGTSLSVRIEDTPCRDVMSGEAFPTTVTLETEGRSYTGCGLRLST